MGNRGAPDPKPEPLPRPKPTPVIHAKKLTVKEGLRLKKALEATYVGLQPPGRIEILKEGIVVKRKVGFWERVKYLFHGCFKSNIIE